jgi:hypothetical protein
VRITKAASAVSVVNAVIARKARSRQFAAADERGREDIGRGSVTPPSVSLSNGAAGPRRPHPACVDRATVGPNLPLPLGARKAALRGTEGLTTTPPWDSTDGYSLCEQLG